MEYPPRFEPRNYKERLQNLDELMDGEIEEILFNVNIVRGAGIEYGRLQERGADEDEIRPVRQRLDKAESEVITVAKDMKAIGRAYSKRFAPIESERLALEFAPVQPDTTDFLFTRATRFDEAVENWLKGLRFPFRQVNEAIEVMLRIRYTSYVLLTNLMELYTLYHFPANPNLDPFRLTPGFGKDFDRRDTFAQDLDNLANQRKSELRELKTNRENPYINLRFVPSIRDGGITRQDLQKIAMAHIRRTARRPTYETQDIIDELNRQIKLYLHVVREWTRWRNRYNLFTNMKKNYNHVLDSVWILYYKIGGKAGDRVNFEQKITDMGFDTEYLDREIARAKHNAEHYGMILRRSRDRGTLPPEAREARPPPFRPAAASASASARGTSAARRSRASPSSSSQTSARTSTRRRSPSSTKSRA